MPHLCNFLTTLKVIAYPHRHCTKPLTTDKNALLTEQRAEVLPNIRGLDGAGSIPRVRMTQFAQINSSFSPHLLR